LATLLKDNPYVQSGTLSPNHAPELMELMKKNNIGDSNGERTAIIERLTKLTDVPVTVEVDGVKTVVPVQPSYAAVKAAILSGEDQLFNSWNQGWANDIENKLRKQIQTNAVKTVDGKKVSFNQAADDFRAYQASLLQSAALPPDKKKQK